MDEATSHLDAARELAVIEAIGDLGITRVAVAHRLETIQAASRVLHLDAGVLEEITETRSPPSSAPSPVRVQSRE